MNAADLQKFIRQINCLNDLDFSKMYNDIGLHGQAYIDEKFRLLRTNFVLWICSLDEETLNNIFKWLKENR